MTDINTNVSQRLFDEIRKIVDENRKQLATAVNTVLTSTYWHVGKTIRSEFLNNERAEYGKKVLSLLSQKMTEEYGKGWSVKHLQHCLRFAETFHDYEIVSTLWRQLSWSHFKILMYQETELKMDFYTQMCRLEKWSTRRLQDQIDSMLFERTAVSKKPELLAKQEIVNKWNFFNLTRLT